MSETAGEAPAPLTVATDLTVTIGETVAEVRSTGDRLFVEFPSLVAAARAFRDLPPMGRQQLHDVLTATDLALEVRVRDRTVVVLGSGARPGILSQWVGVTPAELRLGGVLSTVRGELVAFADYLRQYGG